MSFHTSARLRLGLCQHHDHQIHFGGAVSCPRTFQSTQSCLRADTLHPRNELADMFQLLSNDPMASTPAMPFQAHSFPTMTHSGCPAPVKVGKRRAARWSPSSSMPHTTASSPSEIPGFRNMAPSPSLCL